MTPPEFEAAVEADFKEQGFVITHLGKSHDKGVDFIAKNDLSKIAVQVKMYESRIVRYQEFMYLFAGQKLYDCDKSVLITTNTIDKEAKEIAKKLDIDYFENYRTHLRTKDLGSEAEYSIAIKNSDTDFFENWQKHIKPLKGQKIFTATGKENLVTNVTNDYLFRKSSTGADSKIEYKIFEIVYYLVLGSKIVTREEINNRYTKRGSAIIIAVLSHLPEIELVKSPKVALRLRP